jgi:hypothetical protein
MKRVFDATRINEIINDPNVHRFVAEKGAGHLDMGPLLEDRRNILLMDDKDNGGILFHCLDAGLYEAHTSFLPQARGAGALKFAREAITWMMARTDCIELATKVPDFNQQAVMFATAAGMVFDFQRSKAWHGPDGLCAVRYYSLSYQGWAATALGNAERGRRFHDALERFGAHIEHGSDPVHDLHVGAAVETARGGQIEKAIVFYNRWAVRTGYHPVRLVAKEPPIVDIGNALVLISETDIEVLKCRPPLQT